MKVTIEMETQKEMVWRMWSEKQMSYAEIEDETGIKRNQIISIVRGRAARDAFGKIKTTGVCFGVKHVPYTPDVNNEMDCGTPEFKCSWNDISKEEKMYWKIIEEDPLREHEPLDIDETVGSYKPKSKS